MTALVEVQNLTAWYGRSAVLRGVDLHIKRGEILGLVGESGSGKSTLALALLGMTVGLERRGTITMDGTNLETLPDAERAAWRGQRIAMVFQDPSSALNPLFTIGTHIVDVLRRRTPGLGRRAALQQAEAALHSVDIPDPALRLRAYPHELSGGMKQRVMIAMALAAAPDLLLADEPTTALDATIEAGIVRLLQRLRQDFRGSILFISHQLGLVAQLCDAVAVMYAGAVIERGPVAGVTTAPRHPYTARLIACELDAGASNTTIATIPGDVPDPAEHPPGCLFAARCTLAEPRCDTPQVLRSVAPDWDVACWKA